MSGIVGLANPGDRPEADRMVVERLVQKLAFRGPHGLSTWIGPHAAFGHSLLINSPESATDRQPLTLEGQVFIVADCRVDRRARLIEELGQAGQACSATASDSELILRSYLSWGEECLSRLLGEFAFAIWDERSRKLFCGRDRFGVRPFYYALHQGALLFSNTIQCLLANESIPAELNDQAIADFLLFGMNRDLGSTCYKHILSLAPAHSLSWNGGECRLRRYWALAERSESLEVNSDRELEEQFWGVLREAVGDRLRNSRTAILMSGGLDSSSVAAAAKERLKATDASAGLRAYTLVFRSLVDYPEERFASLVSQHLGIEHECFPLDDYEFHPRHSGEHLPMPPQPVEFCFWFTSRALYKRVSQYSPVALTGEAGDVVLCPSYFHFLNLLKKGRLGRFFLDFAKHWKRFGGRPPINLRTWWLGYRPDHGSPPPLPGWLDRDFCRRFNLEDQWREMGAIESNGSHSSRPEAFRLLACPVWPNVVEQNDAGMNGQPLEITSPFLDVRVVEFLMRVPPIPWFQDKHLLRQVIRGRLPPEIWNRPKTHLVNDPMQARMNNPGRQVAPRERWHPTLSKYINIKELEGVDPRKADRVGSQYLRPFGFNIWLNSVGAFRDFQVEK